MIRMERTLFHYLEITIFLHPLIVRKIFVPMLTHRILPLLVGSVFLSTAVIPTTSLAMQQPAGAGANWSHYLGDYASSQYSYLDQITKDNVAQLEIAWRFETGDSAMYQANNLVIDGVVYTPAPSRKVFALDAATGNVIWVADPFEVHNRKVPGTLRGLMYWEDGSDKRIFSAYGTYLFALNAQTGEIVESFGEDGWLHLGDGMDLEERPNVGLNTPGYIYKDLIIIGTQVPENVPGAIRAFDVRTGKRKWIFHTLPRPGEYGSETWPVDYLDKTGGASDWSGLAIDEVRGIVYTSTETAGPDFWGGDRYGKNLFANSLIALNADTGERLWHYQLVHHDLWDMDNPTPPTLLTVNHDGQMIDAVVQGTKMGRLFVFDRVTGEPLWPIEERPAPRTQLPEMPTWPTQPFPTKPPPLTRQRYTENDVSTISPKAKQMTSDLLRISGSWGSFVPPSLDQKIIFPGFDGGMEWGGLAVDDAGILYANVSEIPWFYQFVPTAGENGQPITSGERFYRMECAACHGIDRVGAPGEGFPSLVEISNRHTKESVMQVMVSGGGRMPSFSRLHESRRKAIVDFLFGEEQAPVSNQQAKDGPPYVFRGFHRWFDDEGYPAIKPPWGTLNAVDLNTGTIKWTVPLGEYKELTARGIPATGTENYGGPVVTAGGLIFIGASADGMFRAFDKDTGEILWEHEIPFDANSTPSVYMAKGKQYVVVSAGGAKTNRPKGGLLIAFALSD